MAAFNKFNAFVEDMPEKVHNLATDALTLALSNTAPAATNSVLADITQISYTNLSSRALVTSSSSQSAGTYSLVLADKVLTASGGAVATFRYVIIYNDTPTSPADPLIAWYDYGVGGVTLADGETFTVDFGANLFTLA